MGEQLEDRVTTGWGMVPHAITFSQLSDGAFRLYCMLLRYAQQADRCWPGVVRLAAELHVARATISRRFAELVDARVVERQRRASGTTVTVLLPPEAWRLTSESPCLKNDRSMVVANLQHEEEEEEDNDHVDHDVYCDIHDVVMRRFERDGDVWYAHRLKNGSWCKGVRGGRRGHRRWQDYV